MAKRMSRGTQHVPIPEDGEATLGDHGQTDSLDARARYVTAFQRHERIIVAEAGQPELRRQAVFDQAEEELLSIDIEVDPDVEVLADDLEAKLGQMVDALRGDWRGDQPREVPDGLATSDQLLALSRPLARRERRLLFCGRIEVTLYHYRDQGRALVKPMCSAILKRMRKDASDFNGSVQSLLAHLLVSQAAAGLGIAEAARQAAEANLALVRDLESLTSGQDPSSLRSLLEANTDQVRNQFNVACAVACLTTYGIVSVDHLRRLQGLKSVDYLWHRTSEFRQSAEGQADLRRMTRYIDKALRIVQGMARKRPLPVEPILALFKLHPVIGRGPVRTRDTTDDDGLAEHDLLSG